MKKRYAILLILLLWMPILHGAWNKNAPAATLGLNVSNPIILGNFAALETAIGANHDFSTGGTNSGKHTTIVMEEQSSITTGAKEMGLYCADLGTAPGLYLRPQSNGTVIQWSDIAGKIVNAAMADDSIDSDQYVDASIDLAHLSVNSIDSDQYVDNSIDPAHLVDDFTFDTFPLSPSSAPDANYELANKKYVDDQVALRAFGEYTNEDSNNDAMVKAHAYLANQDGFVTAKVIHSGTLQYLKGFIGTTTNPAGAGDEIQSTAQQAGTPYTSSIGFPVASGKYFEITTTSTNEPTIIWHPKGTLVKCTDQDS